jgi:FkbM family methyltransferase
VLIDGRYWKVRAPDDDGTKLAFLDIFLDDCYGVEKIGHHVGTVLDIGAHAGFFSMHARDIFPDAIIHAYEPNPSMRQFLEYQAEQGGFTSCMQAVGNEGGMVTLETSDNSVLTRSRPCLNGGIPQVAFRHCIARLGGIADLVKMDCEGAEWSILLDKDAWAAVRSLAMEYHLVDGRNGQEVATTVNDLGFRILKQTRMGPTWGMLWATRGVKSGTGQMNCSGNQRH